MIWESLTDSLICRDIEASSYQDVMQVVGGKLTDAGYVKESYVDALITRERSFPTGIDMNGVGVAIPHTNPEHVKQPGIAIGVLRRPVSFFQMGTTDVQVSVRLVFVLAVTNPNAHIGTLQRIIQVIQDTKVLKAIIAAADAAEIIQIIQAKEKTIENK